MAPDYGAPYHQIHRADYYAILHRLASSAPGVRIYLGVTVCDVRPDRLSRVDRASGSRLAKRSMPILSSSWAV